MTHQTTQNFSGAALASKVAAQEFAEDFADLLTVFDTNTVNRALFGLFATTHRDDMPITYEDLCKGLLDLKDRGVIVAEFRSDLADEQLAELRARFGAQTVSATPSTTPTAPTPDPVAECVSDYRTLGSNAFKLKWMGVRRPVYEAAVAAGRI